MTDAAPTAPADIIGFARRWAAVAQRDYAQRVAGLDRYELAALHGWVKGEMDATIRADLMVHGDTPKIAGPFEHYGRVEFVVTQRGPAPDPEVLALHIMATLGWSTDADGLDLARRLCTEARAAP